MTSVVWVVIGLACTLMPGTVSALPLPPCLRRAHSRPPPRLTQSLVVFVQVVKILRVLDSVAGFLVHKITGADC